MSGRGVKQGGGSGWLPFLMGGVAGLAGHVVNDAWFKQSPWLVNMLVAVGVGTAVGLATSLFSKCAPSPDPKQDA